MYKFISLDFQDVSLLYQKFLEVKIYKDSLRDLSTMALHRRTKGIDKITKLIVQEVGIFFTVLMMRKNQVFLITAILNSQQHNQKILHEFFSEVFIFLTFSWELKIFFTFLVIKGIYMVTPYYIKLVIKTLGTIARMSTPI